ncbi:MAG TPA: tRNA (adenine-N1)-methyltransferase [Actinomycetota bacterium]|nr:tRNA (adenine-N1)-methyltransferase [Actinomycetota bacterium]
MTLQEGDAVLLSDSKKRRYLIRLETGGSFHFHRGIVSHDDLIGRKDGSRVRSTSGEILIAVVPTYEEYILKMPRGAQVVYPKDVATIIVKGDIYPGARVVEAGAGSGALTLGLLRAVGPKGSVTTYEVREDFANNAQRNIASFLEDSSNHVLRMGDFYERTQEPESSFDRTVLDLPEPWRCLEEAARILRSGGILTAYLPTVMQFHSLVGAMRASGSWEMIQTVETLLRSWHVEERSVRPDHRMVGHTGFVTVARLVSTS